LAYLYGRHSFNAEEADMLEAKAMKVPNKYRGFVSDWVLTGYSKVASIRKGQIPKP
jgi:hypothetical protein